MPKKKVMQKIAHYPGRHRSHARRKEPMGYSPSGYEFMDSPMPTNRKVHIASPSSATEIRNTLGVNSADLRAALEALED